MARNDLQQKVFPGGIYNRYNVITMRTGGRSSVTYNDNRTGQIGTSGAWELHVSGYYDPNGIIRRVMAPDEPVTERSLNPATKAYDV